MLNSIRDNLDKNDIISEIKLSLNYPSNKNNMCVIVEGIDDIKIMRKFLSKDVCLYESFSGKLGAYDIINFFKSKNVISICDKDYEEKNTLVSNKFFYDYCNLEMMILSFDDVLDNLICESTENYNDAIILRDEMLSLLQPVSIIRQYNYINDCDLKLEGLISRDVIDFNNKKIDLQKILSRIINRNFNKDTSFIQQLSSVAYKGNLLDITNGHDATNLIHYLLKLDHKNVLVGMRCSFNFYLFRTTYLYNDLIGYEKKYKVKIFDK